MWQDRVNSFFLGFSSILLSLNVWRLYQAKHIEGVSVLPVIFFTLWGVWDWYYFPSLGQWFSLGASVIAVTVNTTWLSMAFHYRLNQVPPPVTREEEYDD